MSEEEYLIAKQMVQEYENNILKSQRSIAVISLDAHDFKIWKVKKFNNNSLEQHRYLSTIKKFKINNTNYYCISNIGDLCSLTVDEIIETKHAKANKEYEQIKLVTRGNLRNTFISNNTELQVNSDKIIN